MARGTILNKMALNIGDNYLIPVLQVSLLSYVMASRIWRTANTANVTAELFYYYANKN